MCTLKFCVKKINPFILGWKMPNKWPKAKIKINFKSLRQTLSLQRCWKPQDTHCTLHITLWTLHRAYCTVHNAVFTMQCAHITVHSALYTHCIVHIANIDPFSLVVKHKVNVYKQNIVEAYMEFFGFIHQCLPVLRFSSWIFSEGNLTL